MKRKSILIVDDEPNNLHVLRQILKDDYQLTFAKSGEEALQRAEKQRPNLILLDIMMPDMDGYEVCRRLKTNPLLKKTPVIFISAMNEVEDEALGFEVGAVDYLTKPVSRAIVKARIKTHLSLVGIDELKQTQLELIERLGCAAEYKDNETGLHVIRMGHYARVIGRGCGMDEEEVELLFHAAPMHDIGKIGIPDHILNKPGKLSKEEWQIMRKHPEFGANIIGQHRCQLLEMARVIALTHHEKWNGTGYPNNLAGDEIPLVGRIVAISDVFDALSSRRPYKEPWPTQKTMKVIIEERGQHFDPEIVDLFQTLLPDILAIKEQWAEEERPAP